MILKCILKKQKIRVLYTSSSTGSGCDPVGGKEVDSRITTIISGN